MPNSNRPIRSIIVQEFLGNKFEGCEQRGHEKRIVGVSDIYLTHTFHPKDEYGRDLQLKEEDIDEYGEYVIVVCEDGRTYHFPNTRTEIFSAPIMPTQE